MKLTILCLSLIFLLGLTSAAPFVEYRIEGDEVNTRIILEDQLSTIRLPRDAYDITSDGNYELVQQGVELILVTDSKEISYKSKSQIEKVNGGFLFISKNSLLENVNASLYLPKGATIDDEFFLFPKNYTIRTNGQNIIVQWERMNDDTLVSYKIVNDSDIYLFATIAILLSLSILLFFFQLSKRKKRFSQNLFGDERRVINFLLKQKGRSAWTKEIVHGLDISRVKLSRKLRSLEEKGIVRRTPHGNENRVFLTK